MQIIETNNQDRQKTTVYIDAENSKKIEEFLPKNKNVKSDFINQAIKKEFERIEKERAKKQSMAALDKLYEMRVKSDKSAVEQVRDIRHERVDRINSVVSENE